MKKLGHLIHKGVDNKTWKPILLGKNGPNISHLFFVDDLFLFIEANVEKARTIREVLETFGLVLRLKVNAKMLPPMLLPRYVVFLGLKQ